MIKTVEIKNFRGYSHAKLADCKRINIVVGENGSGKTSLLEALFLAAGGSVEIALRLRDWRGFENRFTGSIAGAEDALWRDYFHKFNKNIPVSVSLLGTEWRNRSMTLRFNDPTEPAGTISKRPLKDDVTTPPLVTFEWIGPKGRRVIVKPQIRDGKMQLPSPVQLPEETFFFPASHSYSAVETAVRFSELSKRFKSDAVVKRFKHHFPSVLDVSLELVAGVPMVSAAMEGLSEKIPLNLVSSGMSKLASILFALASQPGSVALIDEIENGLHYKRLPDMWESLLDFCTSSDAQIFASTHSAECLNAAAALAEKHPDSFCVLQTGENGKIFQFGGERFAEAVKESIELR